MLTLDEMSIVGVKLIFVRLLVILGVVIDLIGRVFVALVAVIDLDAFSVIACVV